MADDEIPDDLAGEEPEVVVEDEEFDGEEFVGDDEVFVEVDVEVDDDAAIVVDLEEADDEPVVRGRKKAAAKDEEEADDEDELDPDDVEADLDAILKDRIAANADDDDEDEAEEVVARAAPDTPDGVVPKKANEFVCTGCFLLVNRAQFGPAGSLECPVGESACPAIEVLEKGAKKK